MAAEAGQTVAAEVRRSEESASGRSVGNVEELTGKSQKPRPPEPRAGHPPGECRTYGASDPYFYIFPTLTGWTNVWRASGA
jgi:hypothetical protein